VAASHKKFLKWLLVSGLFLLAAFLLYRNLGSYDPEEMRRSLMSLPGAAWGQALLWAAASYSCLTLFDYFALRFAGHPLPYPKAAIASFTSLSIGHSLGVAFLSSGAIRYRFYSQQGLSVADVAKVILYCGITVGIGLAGLGALALMLRAEAAAEILNVSPVAATAIGAAIALLLAGYLAAAALIRKKIRIRTASFELPRLPLAIAQFVIGPVNFACVAACLYSVMEAVADVTYPAVVTVYVLGNVASLISHVPGGLGVLESVVLYLAPGANVAVALVAFRCIYFLLPLSIGATLFAFTEFRLRTRPVAETQAE
jgi:uncharacterized membrane protein YbhN (UPF0104 family)